MTLLRPLVCISALLVGSATASFGAPAAAGGYHLLKKIPLGSAASGPEYFDYITVDAVARRLYLAHGTEVKVLDADTFAILGNVTGLKKDHGVALVPEFGRGFISDGDAGQAVIFDLKTFKTIGQVKAEPDADSVLYDPATKRIFVFEGDTKSATVIDPATGTVVATIPLGGGRSKQSPTARGRSSTISKARMKRSPSIPGR
jgi:hypothetical protein